MKFVIETNLASKPAWSARAAARRVQEQACTAMGP